MALWRKRKLDPDEAHAKAVEAFEDGDMKTALSLFDVAIDGEPTGERYYYRGVIHDMMGDESRSLSDLTMAVQLDPQNSQALYSLAIVTTQAGNVEDGFDAIQRAYRVAPDDYRVLNQYAMLLANHPDESTRDLNEAARIAKHACELTSWQDEICVSAYKSIMAGLGQEEEAEAASATLDEVLDTTDEDMTRKVVEYFETVTQLKIHENALQNIIPDEIPIAVQTIENWNGHHVLFTNGMSARAMKQPESDRDFRFAELVMLIEEDFQFVGVDNLEKSWPWIALHTLGRCPHSTSNGFPDELSVYTIQGDPKPLVEGCDYSAWILLPNLSPPFDQFSPRYTGRTINLITALPIFLEEYELARRSGPDALLEKLQSASIPPVLLTSRPNVGRL
jgi:tetratricopeptide (TPR) repeat protein